LYYTIGSNKLIVIVTKLDIDRFLVIPLIVSLIASK
jgi:hypothetical protein